MNRSIVLPSDSEPYHKNRIFVRLTYKPLSFDPVEEWTPMIAGLIQTFYSPDGAPGIIKVVYYCDSQTGEARIKQSGWKQYEHGFHYSLRDKKLDVTDRGSWLHLSPPVPAHHVYGRVTEKTVFELMNRLSGPELLGNATKEIVFQQEVVKILNPQMR